MKGKKMLLNGNGKKKLGKGIGRLCVFLLAISMVVSCNNVMEPPTASGVGDGRAYLKISAGETARTVFPQLDFQNLSFALTGSLAGGNSQSLGSWNTYSAMSSALISLEIGEWSFTLTASNASGVVLEKSIAKNIISGTHVLDFSTLAFSSGSGSVSVTLILPLNHGVATASAALYEVSSNNLVTVTEKSLSLDSQADGRQAVTYTQSNVTGGNYFLKFKFTQALKSDVTDVYQELVQVAPHLTSSATRELAALNSYYQVTLNANGGTLPSTPSSFSRYKDVLLPTPTKAGYIFGGWYDKGDFNKTPVKTLPKGTDRDHNLTARWVQEVFVSAGGNDSNFGVSSSPFKSLQAAVNAIDAANDGTSSYTIKVMDNVDDSSSSSYDTSNNSALINIAPTKALNITIKSSDDNTQRTINAGRDASKTGRVMYVGTHATVTIQNLVLTGGNIAESGGGVANYGTFEMTSGSVTNNTSGHNGGGVNNSGTLTMTGGTIANNTATADGGGVYVAADKTFNMTSGSSAAPTINNNQAKNGGGVYLVATGIFGMGVGTISGNTATVDGHGVYDAGILSLAGSAVIGDELYWSGTADAITITSSLTPSSGTTATIRPVSYTSKQVLSSASNVTLANEVGKFVLVPSSDGNRYYINDSGNITEYLGESSSTVLSEIQSGNYSGTYVLNKSTTMSDIESILREIANAKASGNDTSSLVLDLSLTTITSFTSPSGLTSDGMTGSAAISLSEIIFPDTLTSLDTTAFQYASIRATFEDPDSMWTDTVNNYTKKASDIELGSGLTWNKN